MTIQSIPFESLNLEDVHICGCGVSLKKVDDVVRKGITDLQIIKRLTHLAMGFCRAGSASSTARWSSPRERAPI